MALNEYKPQKLYYSIKEVAEMFGLNESTLGDRVSLPAPQDFRTCQGTPVSGEGH